MSARCGQLLIQIPTCHREEADECHSSGQYARGSSIFPLIVWHGLQDFSAGAGPAIPIALILSDYGLIVWSQLPTGAAAGLTSAPTQQRVTGQMTGWRTSKTREYASRRRRPSTIA